MRHYTQAIIDPIAEGLPLKLSVLILQYYEPSLLEHILECVPKKKDNDWRVIAQAWVRVGQDNFQNRNYDQAIQFYVQSLPLFERVNKKVAEDVKKIAGIHLIIGHCYRYKRDPDWAMQHYKESLALFNKLWPKSDAHWKMICDALYAMGEINSNKKNYAQAVKDYEQLIASEECIQEKSSDVLEIRDLAYPMLAKHYNLSFADHLEKGDFAAAMNSAYEFISFYCRNLNFMYAQGPLLFNQLDVLKLRDFCETKLEGDPDFCLSVKTHWDIVRVISYIFMPNLPDDDQVNCLLTLNVLLSIDPIFSDGLMLKGLGLLCQALGCAFTIQMPNWLNPTFAFELGKEGVCESLKSKVIALEVKLTSRLIQLLSLKDVLAEKDRTIATLQTENQELREQTRKRDKAGAEKKSEPKSGFKSPGNSFWG